MATRPQHAILYRLHTCALLFCVVWWAESMLCKSYLRQNVVCSKGRRSPLTSQSQDRHATYKYVYILALVRVPSEICLLCLLYRPFSSCCLSIEVLVYHIFRSAWLMALSLSLESIGRDMNLTEKGMSRLDAWPVRLIISSRDQLVLLPCR